ncbi:hypothetical protein VTN00DRAFT_3140 [Thermoascus crustaceus]|uniref:uncharacterized protein n=1 Tax=Thermoascus crustaceus TaxID=5088 RepID=UPI003742D8CE
MRGQRWVRAWMLLVCGPATEMDLYGRRRAGTERRMGQAYGTGITVPDGTETDLRTVPRQIDPHACRSCAASAPAAIGNNSPRPFQL